MVLQYVGKHGSISRGEVAELCRITSLQTYRLLKRLERLGRIERVAGSTKAARNGQAQLIARRTIGNRSRAILAPLRFRMPEVSRNP